MKQHNNPTADPTMSFVKDLALVLAPLAAALTILIVAVAKYNDQLNQGIAPPASVRIMVLVPAALFTMLSLAMLVKMATPPKTEEVE